MKLSRIFLTGFAVSALTFVLSACGSEQEQPQQSPPQVSAESVEAKTVPIIFEYSGRITAYRETEVRARVGGILLQRNFVEGSEVKQGDVLFEIDPATYQAQAAQARAQLAQTIATAEQSQRDADRAEELLRQRVYSTAQRDQAFATRDLNQAQVDAARAALQQAELNLEYTKVTAPISGITSRENVPEGSLIGTDSASSLLTTITQRHPVYVNFSYADDEAAEIRKLMSEMEANGHPVEQLRVEISFGDGTVYEKQGVVDFTSPTIDEHTGTFSVRAVVENDDDRLIPGQFVRVKVLGLEQANAIVIPERALTQNAQGQSVYVVKEQDVPVMQNGQPTSETTKMMMAEMRPVTVSRQLSNKDWLISDGLQDGEMILTNGLPRVQMALMGAMAQGHNSVPVMITPEEAEAPAAQPNNAQTPQASSEGGE